MIEFPKVMEADPLILNKLPEEPMVTTSFPVPARMVRAPPIRESPSPSSVMVLSPFPRFRVTLPVTVVAAALVNSISSVPFPEITVRLPLMVVGLVAEKVAVCLLPCPKLTVALPRMVDPSTATESVNDPLMKTRLPRNWVSSAVSSELAKVSPAVLLTVKEFSKTLTPVTAVVAPVALS